jgi:hypothetical protein
MAMKCSWDRFERCLYGVMAVGLILVGGWNGGWFAGGCLTAGLLLLIFVVRDDYFGWWT